MSVGRKIAAIGTITNQKRKSVKKVLGIRSPKGISKIPKISGMISIPFSLFIDL